MHEIRTTYGFVIWSKGRGEADKTLSIFTRDFGLITATALGIRLGKSKLRHHTQDYAFGEYSLVRGKEFWRLTDASEIGPARGEEIGVFKFGECRSSSSAFPQRVKALGHARLHPLGNAATNDFAAESPNLKTPISSPRAGAELVAKIASILRRLLHGEEAHKELFDCVWACKTFMDKNAETEIGGEKMATLESLTVGRILHQLGYMGDDGELGGCLKSSEINDELLEALNDKRAALNRHINKALRESQL